jgi:hypothetical protein
MKEAFSFEESFLKPYCSVADILFWLMFWYSTYTISIYLFIFKYKIYNFSRIFEKDVSKEIGQKF